MKKIDNMMLAGISLIALALFLFAGVLFYAQRNNVTVLGNPREEVAAKSTVDDSGNTQSSTAASESDSSTQSTAADSQSASDPQPATSSNVPSAADATDWLSYVNAIRASAGIPPVTEDAGLSSAAQAHARYMVANNSSAHSQDPSSPEYSEAGNQAAKDGLLYADTQTSAGYVESVAYWVSGPFHLVPLLNPRLDKMGYADFTDVGSSGTKMAGVLNLGPRGTHGADEDVYPAMFPGDGQSTAVLRQFLFEWPNAEGHCGFKRPVGPPIVLMVGTGNQTPSVGNYSVTENGSAIEVCMMNETNFSGMDSSQQSVGRTILDSLDAVVLIPHSPLKAGSTYEVNIEVSGKSHSWSFSAE